MKSNSIFPDFFADLWRIERKKNKVYALHKRRNVSLAICAMVKLFVMVYYIQ